VTTDRQRHTDKYRQTKTDRQRQTDKDRQTKTTINRGRLLECDHVKFGAFSVVLVFFGAQRYEARKVLLPFSYHHHAVCVCVCVCVRVVAHACGYVQVCVRVSTHWINCVLCLVYGVAQYFDAQYFDVSYAHNIDVDTTP